LMEIQIVVGNFGADVWSAKAVLLPPAVAPPSQIVGGCKVTDESGAGKPGRSMDAGDLTIGGGPNGDLILSYDPSLGIYTEDLAEPTSTGESGPLSSPSAL